MTLELDDIQGLVLWPYKEHPHARYVTSRVTDGAAARRSLSRLLAGSHAVRASDESRRHGGHGLNVAFTADGLRQLGLDSDELATFPLEFRQGMHHPQRARVLGDDPARWEIGAPGTQLGAIDALFLVFAATEEEARAQAARYETLDGLSHVHTQAALLPDDRREHFGFHDGIAQPHVAGSGRQERHPEARLPAGEFVLGYPNAYGRVASSPRARDGFDLGKNGSFLVFRKLRQDVAAFWRFMFEAAEPASGETVEDAAVRLASKMVGRWPSGAPVVLHPSRDPGVLRRDGDAFGFAREDPHGTRCPLGAHIRRSNPRDMLPPSREDSLEMTNRHRILRRGRIYGEPLSGARPSRDDGQERGLVFLAVNASIRRQFEFIQQTWVQNPCFAGLRGERDPLIGGIAGDREERYFTIPQAPVRRRVRAMPQVVEMRGGGYFFLPGLRALRYLAGAAGD